MLAEGLPENIDKCLSKLNYYHTENHIHSDEGSGWYLETEITTHENIVPKALIEELLKTDSVIDVKIK